MIGQTISHYKITEKLGGGGMGVVYKAEDTRLGRNVALKFLPEEMQQDSTARKRFLREAKSAAALDHPYICHIHEVGEAEGKSFICMEYIQGQTLSQKLTEGPLPLKNALQMAVEVAEALEAAHKNDIVHRDLKPANIMLTPEGHVKIMDFGLAKRVTPPDDQKEEITTALTREGSTLGTIPYMSPEQIRGQEVDTRSDIFSFGVVLYEMLAGVNPFSKGGHMETAKAVLSDTAPPLTRYTEDVPLLLQHTVKKMLAKEADQRYQLIHDVRTDLGELSVTSGESEVSAEVLAAPPAKPSYLWPAVAGGVVVLVILALALFWPSTPAPHTEAIDSIAVLPFENRSGDPELEYVSDGVAEGIINRLSQLSSLNKVMSSSTVRRYKGKEVNAQTVRQEIDVRAVVMGSMVQQGENIRVNVELVDGQSNATLWGDSYTRPRSALYEIEEYLSREIADALGIQLTTEQGEHLTQRNTESSEAHDAYLQGRHYLLIGTKEAGETAIEYFKQAIETDPDYALAHAGLSDAHRAMNTARLPPWETMPPAREAAMEALRLDDTLAEAHTSLANVRFFYDYDWVQTEAEFKRALELNPSLAEAHDGYALYLALMLREEEAIREMQRAKELDPFSPRFDANMVRVLFLTRRYDQAIERGLKVISTHPNFALGYRFLGHAYRFIERFNEATAHMSRAVELDRNPANVAFLAEAYALSGETSKAHEMLEELDRLGDQGLYYCPYERARVYIALGDTDEAFDLLGQAYDERAYCMPFLHADQALDPIRDDPRFQDLMRRMNLEP